jgi:two-component system copper resistance phosphate regulon response regulator CusR
MRLLVVEDEADLARFLRRGLIEAAHAVDVVSDGIAALEAATLNPYDAIVLDVMIPRLDGMEVCRRLRSAGSHVPILMLTARDTVDEKIAGLDAGADDYLAKPFEFGELLARLRALLRRGSITSSPMIRAGELQIDTRSRRVQLGDDLLALTTKEYGVLEHLARNAGRIVTREELSEHVWDQNFDPFSNLIEVYVNRLRRQFEKHTAKRYIHTIRGAGYMLEEAE